MANMIRALGLMSGTSMDGVDVALLTTDGENTINPLGHVFCAYDDTIKTAIRACLGYATDPDGRVAHAEQLVTTAHAAAIANFRATYPQASIELVGFHGQTIFHDPAHGKTWQIGDGQALADASGLPVVFDFRTADVKAGGQGAPLIPLYHQALCQNAGLDIPIAVLNLGGVANITWTDGQQCIACDTGPANALIDDWMLKHTGIAYDKDGAIALSGRPDMARIAIWLAHPFFAAPAPKSLDRNAFAHCRVDDLSVADGAATLTAFTVASIVAGLKLCPEKPTQLIVAGGGRHNLAVMQGLATQTGLRVTNADDLGWQGDQLEAQGFAYLAVRSLRGLPLSLPGTTGVPRPQTGGQYVKPR